MQVHFARLIPVPSPAALFAIRENSALLIISALIPEPLPVLLHAPDLLAILIGFEKDCDEGSRW